MNSFRYNPAPEDKLLFLLTRQDFQAAHRQAALDICRQYPLNWTAVFETANLHGVAPLVYVNLRQFPALPNGIPPNVAARFRRRLMHNMADSQRLAQNLSRAVAFFAARSIPVMLIKGMALDLLVYHQPYYTVLNDADLVLGVERSRIPPRQLAEFAAFFHQTGLEYDFFEHHDVTMNGVLPVDFRQIWADAVKAGFNGQSVRVMCPEDMLISLCINSCRKRYFRLKALCDIAETISHYPALNWPKLAAKARAYDCRAIVYAALFITRLTTGCNLPPGFLAALQVNPVQAAVIRGLARQMSLRAFASLQNRPGLFGKSVGLSLVLPYATLRGYQMWRRMVFAYRTRPTPNKNPPQKP